ncbi:MAG TPA: hypothetical protein VEL76_18915, partial [Gemmataceae bacterium]|nr:hypothetical protein [Gemmataceae bacterium]
GIVWPRCVEWAILGMSAGITAGRAGIVGGLLGGAMGGSLFEVLTRGRLAGWGGAIGLILVGASIGAFIGLVAWLERRAGEVRTS